ncbi:hypothetical protein TorRG33x02_320240, partial [Trema orientale]
CLVGKMLEVCSEKENMHIVLFLMQKSEKLTKISLTTHEIPILLYIAKGQLFCETNYFELLGTSSRSFQEDASLGKDDNNVEIEFLCEEKVESRDSFSERLEFQSDGIPSFSRVCRMARMMYGRPRKIGLLHQWTKDELKWIFSTSVYQNHIKRKMKLLLKLSNFSLNLRTNSSKKCGVN